MKEKQTKTGQGLPDFAQKPPKPPGQWLCEWIDEAKAAGEKEPTAMALASVGVDSMPTVRFVLCKGASEEGVRFFTNLESKKGRELASRPGAAVAFHWPNMGRQVRIEGHVRQVTDDEADAYYATRGRLSQVGAWASQQSRPLATRQQLLDAVAACETRFSAPVIPRPSHWSGFWLVASRWEFWQQRPGRLHERWTLSMGDSGWLAWQLQP
ncbi:MAG: pyridoxamine 5'-phosphate oxidase [Rhodothermales bacterium]|jgi:pyridoxamine 5'-phosphate oxidase